LSEGADGRQRGGGKGEELAAVERFHGMFTFRLSHLEWAADLALL
jgi:hypothetical protein